MHDFLTLCLKVFVCRADEYLVLFVHDNWDHPRAVPIWCVRLSPPYRTSRCQVGLLRIVTVWRVPVPPRLGRLLVALLEPRSDDGIVNWNLLEERIETRLVYPILRIPAEPLP